MPQGAVRWFHQVMGCGVIAPDDGSPGLRLWADAVRAADLAPPKRGDRLEYDAVRDADGGHHAVNLRAATAGPRPADPSTLAGSFQATNPRAARLAPALKPPPARGRPH